MFKVINRIKEHRVLYSLSAYPYWWNGKSWVGSKSKDYRNSGKFRGTKGKAPCFETNSKTELVRAIRLAFVANTINRNEHQTQVTVSYSITVRRKRYSDSRHRVRNIRFTYGNLVCFTKIFFN